MGAGQQVAKKAGATPKSTWECEGFEEIHAARVLLFLRADGRSRLELCGTSYTLRMQDEEYFGGLRKEVLRRDGYRCRVCDG